MNINKELLDPGSKMICDSIIFNFIDQALKTANLNKVLELPYSQYEQVFRQWITTNSYNTVLGLDKFTHSSFSYGTTSSFVEFISRHSNRRVRGSRSDFVLTKVLAKAYNKNFCRLEDEPLDCNDCVIVSLPFSGNGGMFPNLDNLLNECDAKGIPVMIDAAYFGISFDVTYNLNHACITDFVVSHSKNFYLLDFRVGIRFTKDLIDDGLGAPILMYNTFNKLGGHIGIELMKQFSHKWLIDRYKTRYNEVCNQLELAPTNTITLALGNNNYKKFQRGDYNRVCVSDIISY